MKKVILTVVAIAAFVLTAAAQNNAASKTLSVSGKARIITPITLAKTTDLDFGIIARGTTGTSTVLVNTTETQVPSVVGDAIVLSSAPQTAAKFTISGESGKAYTITFPTSQTITQVSGSNTLSITNINWSNGPTTTGTIGTGNTFYIGGTLNVPSTATDASYIGTFNVTVAYN